MPSPKKKPALGRGLGSLMGEAQSETGYTATETQMSIEEIFPNPNQPRTHFNESELEELSVENELNKLTLEEHFEYYKKIGLDKKDIIKKIAKDRNVPKNEIYQHFIN